MERTYSNLFAQFSGWNIPSLLFQSAWAPSKNSWRSFTPALVSVRSVLFPTSICQQLVGGGPNLPLSRHAIRLWNFKWPWLPVIKTCSFSSIRMNRNLYGPVSWHMYAVRTFIRTIKTDNMRPSLFCLVASTIHSLAVLYYRRNHTLSWIHSSVCIGSL